MSLTETNTEDWTTGKENRLRKVLSYREEEFRVGWTSCVKTYDWYVPLLVVSMMARANYFFFSKLRSR